MLINCQNTILAVLCLLFSINAANSQKEITALRITEKIEIDGKLDEASWAKAEMATGFITWAPEAGKTPAQKTEARIMYDDDALYFGAYLKTDSREEIKTQLTERDQVGNTDWAGIIIDTYGNGTEGFEFLLCATGTQFDAKVSISDGEDQNWDEIWYSAVELTDKGWYAEMRIPYSAIRFPNKDVQSWRINIMRRMADSGQRASYQYIDPEISGFVNQTAFVRGVSNIKAPLRLALYPYVSAYVENYNDPDGIPSNSTGMSYSGGMDLKYGINDAFTLDMTLIPDFGQVRSDDRVLNLSPFEVRYAENRPFFTEGVDLFNKGGLFYSRRVGGTPLGFWDVEDQLAEGEEILNNPQEAQLFNATKLSGRTNSGIGIGVFNALSNSAHAEISNSENSEVRRIETSPLTNYNVFVIDKNLKNNSYISLTNTNVTRKGDNYYNANVTATEFDISTDSLKYGFWGNAGVSQLIYPDADNVNGLKYSITAAKISGKLRYDLEFSGVSRDFDSNDLGYNTRTNVKDYDFGIYYNENEGWKSFSRGNIWFNTFYRTTYDENKFSTLHFNSGFWAQTKKLWEINMWTNYSPVSHDYFEPRVEGRYLQRPSFYNMGWWIGSDSRKKFYCGASIFGMKYFEDGANRYSFNINPRYRFSDKFTVSLSISNSVNHNVRGYVDSYNDEPIIGLRDQQTISNLLRMNYTFNNKMSLNFRARHYWSKVSYNGYHGIEEDGSLLDTDYDEENGLIFTIFNIDTDFTWRIAPGSDLIFVWKNSIFGAENLSDLDLQDYSYLDGIKSLDEYPEVNSLSVRLVYFLNGQNLFR